MQYGLQNLGVAYIEKPGDLSHPIDVMFSSHVIEHMSNPGDFKKWSDSILGDSGFVIMTCPNGSDYAKVNNTSWSKQWGEVHPNYISTTILLAYILRMEVCSEV